FYKARYIYLNILFPLSVLFNMLLIAFTSILILIFKEKIKVLKFANLKERGTISKDRFKIYSLSFQPRDLRIISELSRF
ncbi:MAG: hypothetical protein ACFFA0_12780, partial [Promethearchaeota archaeon]